MEISNTSCKYHNRLSLHLFTVTSHNGRCLRSDGSNSVLSESTLLYEHTLAACERKCNEQMVCDAFSYEPKTWNCVTYKNGGYTKGDGQLGVKCYISTNQGKFSIVIYKHSASTMHLNIILIKQN